MVKLIADWERSSAGAGMVDDHVNETENQQTMSSLMEMIESLS